MGSIGFCPNLATCDNTNRGQVLATLRAAGLSAGGPPPQRRRGIRALAENHNKLAKSRGGRGPHRRTSAPFREQEGLRRTACAEIRVRAGSEEAQHRGGQERERQCPQEDACGEGGAGPSPRRLDPVGLARLRAEQRHGAPRPATAAACPVRDGGGGNEPSSFRACPQALLGRPHQDCADPECAARHLRRVILDRRPPAAVGLPPASPDASADPPPPKVVRSVARMQAGGDHCCRVCRSQTPP